MADNSVYDVAMSLQLAESMARRIAIAATNIRMKVDHAKLKNETEIDGQEIATIIRDLAKSLRFDKL